jgi:hypothetical protein
MIMRCRAMPGQGGNICDLGRLPFQIANSTRRGDHDRVLEESKINVIGRWQGCSGI